MCLALVAPAALADIYKHVDADGHVTYSNSARPGAKRIIVDPAPAATSPAPTGKAKARAPTPENFPKVDAGTQRQRDGIRRQLLLEELKAEEALLAAARDALATKPGKSPGDSARLRDSVRLHEKNIEMLNKELAHTR
jgi:hypothetical protein